jgi:peptidoglycan hydrolase-like protein with peptidoglycan-binding domain
VGTIESAQRNNQVNVAIGVEFADAVTPSTQAGGTITAVGIGPGSEVTTGTRVMDVDARGVVAYVADSPLYRDISRGVEGPDVATAQSLLTHLGFATGAADGKAGPATEKAIKAFNLAYGYGKSNSVLTLASLAWVGTVPATVNEMSVHLGGQVAPGTELFTTTAALAAITVTEPPGDALDGEWALTVNGVTAPYEPGSGRITDPEAVAAMAATLGAATEGIGTLQLATPLTVASVPSSAVVTDATGGTCIFASADAAPTAVEAAGGSLGTVDLDLSLVGEPVLLNPREVREDLTCAGS